jgi:hypothetical protein
VASARALISLSRISHLEAKAISIDQVPRHHPQDIRWLEAEGLNLEV